MNKTPGGFVLGTLVATAIWSIAVIFVSSASAKEWFGPLATLIAASVAGWVAYTLGRGQIAIAASQADIARRNWETANEKIVLELFERRLAILEELRTLIGEVVRHGKAPDELFLRYLRATDRVQYFFGSDVQRYVEELRLTLIDFGLAETMMGSASGDERVKWIEKRSKLFIKVSDFYTVVPPLFAPYLKAHQRID